MRWRAVFFCLVGLGVVSGGCASRAGQARRDDQSVVTTAEKRVPDAVPERVAASREAGAVDDPEVTEVRFGGEESRARREARAAKKVSVVEAKRRVEVDPTATAAPTPTLAPPRPRK
jgi:hypothetical protein